MDTIDATKVFKKSKGKIENTSNSFCIFLKIDLI